MAEETLDETTREIDSARREIERSLEARVREVVEEKVSAIPERRPAAAKKLKVPLEISEKFDLSKDIIQVDPRELKFHPAHRLFSDMRGEELAEMVKSVKVHGVVEPVVITPKKVVISGRQRTLAAISAGLEKIDCRIANVNEDEAEMLLIVSNLRRRNIPPSETIRAVYRYSQLFCLRSRAGRPRKNCDPGSQFLSREEMAKRMGIDKRTLFRYQAIAQKLIPEFMSELDGGFLTLKAAYHIAQLPQEVQRVIYENASKRAVILTERDTKDIKESLKSVIEENWVLRRRYDELTRDYQAAILRIEELKKSTSTKVVESPEQREEIKRLRDELKRLKKRAKYLEKAVKERGEEYKQKVSKMKEVLEEHKKRSVVENLLIDFREKIDRFVRGNLRTASLLKGYAEDRGLSTSEKRLLKEVMSPLRGFLDQLEGIL